MHPSHPCNHTQPPNGDKLCKDKKFKSDKERHKGERANPTEQQDNNILVHCKLMRQQMSIALRRKNYKKM